MIYTQLPDGVYACTLYEHTYVYAHDITYMKHIQQPPYGMYYV